MAQPCSFKLKTLTHNCCSGSSASSGRRPPRRLLCRNTTTTTATTPYYSHSRSRSHCHNHYHNPASDAIQGTSRFKKLPDSGSWNPRFPNPPFPSRWFLFANCAFGVCVSSFRDQRKLRIRGLQLVSRMSVSTSFAVSQVHVCSFPNPVCDSPFCLFVNTCSNFCVAVPACVVSVDNLLQCPAEQHQICGRQLGIPDDMPNST